MSLFKSVIFRLLDHLTQHQNVIGCFSLHYHEATIFLDLHSIQITRIHNL